MICVYPAECTDFSTNGNGTIEPTSALVTEPLNGEYELQLVHPIDEAGKWQRLVEGCILRAPVPAATTPRVHFAAPGDDSGTEIYRINTDFAGAETRKGTLNLRAGPGRNYKILAAYKNTLTVQVIAKTSSAWYEVTAPDGKHGYMDTTYLVFDHREGSASAAVHSVVEERQLRDQPFRIYRIVPDLDKITVYARHVFYDLLDNMIQSYKPSCSLSSPIQHMLNCTRTDWYSQTGQQLFRPINTYVAYGQKCIHQCKHSRTILLGSSNSCWKNVEATEIRMILHKQA
ncbi:MAG: SH3 domain-containing protein [Clostridia bacterium]|nr:SH3 domain-containing protein [Clostridia bacterium]